MTDPYLSSLGLAVNANLMVLFCKEHLWALLPERVQGHFNHSHSACRIKVDRQKLEASIVEHDIADEFPDISDTETYPRFKGLKVYKGYRCRTCLKAFIELNSLKTHHYNDHRDLATGPSWVAHDVQQLHPRYAQQIFAVEGAPPRRSDANTLLEEVRKEMNAINTDQMSHSDGGLPLSPWLRTTGWYEHVRHYDISELRSLVAKPDKNEFPRLVQVIEGYFSSSIDLINATEELVLQYLNSPDPVKQ